MFEMANELEKVKEEKEKASKEFTKLHDKIKVNEFFTFTMTMIMSVILLWVNLWNEIKNNNKRNMKK